jgi:hypothetical protein
LSDPDVGNIVRVQVKATNSDGSTIASSKPTDVISGNAAPRVTSKPTISGKAQVGETLTADPASGPKARRRSPTSGIDHGGLASEPPDRLADPVHATRDPQPA